MCLYTSEGVTQKTDQWEMNSVGGSANDVDSHDDGDDDESHDFNDEDDDD